MTDIERRSFGRARERLPCSLRALWPRAILRDHATPPIMMDSTGKRMRTEVDQRLADLREAFRLGRLARSHRGLWQFYLEHNLFDEASLTRTHMLNLLRLARLQWRLALGLIRPS